MDAVPHRRKGRCPWRALATDRRAATAVEYGLVLALIVLTMFGAMAAVGNRTVTMWNNVSTAVQTAR